jgi:hypothetical protein
MAFIEDCTALIALGPNRPQLPRRSRVLMPTTGLIEEPVTQGYTKATHHKTGPAEHQIVLKVLSAGLR